MKKNNLKKFFSHSVMLVAALCLIAFYSCSKDEDPVDDPIASFQYEIDEDNYLHVSFQNFSQNATTYSWDFGDTGTSAEENPTHTYEQPGNYEVVLTATNSVGVSHSYAQTIDINDPHEALALLAGETSKTWRLYRVDSSLGVGENPEKAREWWALYNDGIRPCMYYHEFTFHRDGTFEFDHKGSFWGEGGVFHEDVEGQCFEAVPANMVGPNGEDLSAWLEPTHTFEYDPSTNTVTLIGEGAWIGLPKLGTDGEVAVPQNSVVFQMNIEEHQGYDLLTGSMTYEEAYWDFTYANYSDASLEPDVEEEYDPGEDLPDYTPEEMFNTFASTDEADVKYLVPTESAVTITPGVDDPEDADAPKVGEYHRGDDMHADLKFQMDFNIQFDNFTTVSIDVYVPSSNTYTEGGLTKDIMIWIADASTTQNFWESWVQYLIPAEDVVEDEWVTYTFQLDEPGEGSVGDPLSRTDLDLIGLTIGGSAHNDDGIFYIRNFIFE